MAKKSFARKTQRTIVGAAKSSAARIQKIAIRAATAAATAAAEAAVEAVLSSMRGDAKAARSDKSGEKAGAQVKAKSCCARRRERKDAEPGGRRHRRDPTQ